MGEVLNPTDSQARISYAFRFGTSNKVVHVNEEQLNLIPYLSNLVSHKDDFSSTENSNGEFVLNHPIEYIWFMSIFHSIIFDQPYTLFDKIPEDNNILDTLQLFDYLGINPFPLPLLQGEQVFERIQRQSFGHGGMMPYSHLDLKFKHLVRTKSLNNDDDDKHVKYHKANLFEARQTAAEFVLALSKHEYKLNDKYTMERVYSLIRVILCYPSVFSSRFRQHTLTVMEKHCYSFSKDQRSQLQTIHQTTQDRKIRTHGILSNNGTPLPEFLFPNDFCSRGIHVSRDNKSLSDKFTGELS